MQDFMIWMIICIRQVLDMIDDASRELLKQYLLATNADSDRTYDTLEQFRLSAMKEDDTLRSGNDLFSMIILFYLTEPSRQVIVDILSEVKTIKRGK